MPRKVDLTGHVFGRLTVLEDSGRRGSGGGAVMWRCACSCGAVIVTKSSSLRAGVSQSCGCLNREISSRLTAERNTKHGHCAGGKASTEYAVWAGMWQRCTDCNVDSYVDYGGRGISVCERWADFNAFLADMGPRPDRDHSLDRIDLNGNYEPGNCRWADRSTQGTNRRVGRNNTSGFRGISVDRHGMYRAEIMKHKQSYYLGAFETVDEARSAWMRKFEELNPGVELPDNALRKTGFAAVCGGGEGEKQ